MSSILSLQLLFTRDPPPPGTEPPPRPTYSFFSVSSSVITDRQVLKKLTLCKAQSRSGPATAPPGTQKEVSRFWDGGWPAPASKPTARLVLLRARSHGAAGILHMPTHSSLSQNAEQNDKMLGGKEG